MKTIPERNMIAFYLFLIRRCEQIMYCIDMGIPRLDLELAGNPMSICEKTV